MLKTKLEAIANVTVIVMALAMGYVVLGRYVAAHRVPRSLEPGDRLSVMPNINWSQHRHTLVLALNTGCHFCQVSVPFYRKLANAQQRGGDDLEIVAAFPNDSETVRQFMTREDLNIRSVPAVALDKLKVNATPTLILVDHGGLVERSWVGTLTEAEEVDLLRTALASSPGCSRDGSSAHNLGGKTCDSDSRVQSEN